MANRDQPILDGLHRDVLREGAERPARLFYLSLFLGWLFGSCYSLQDATNSEGCHSLSVNHTDFVAVLCGI